ncbi:zinc-dependent peptidase [Pedobacter sp. NJ-S-72]
MTTYIILLAAFLIALYFIFRDKKSKQLPENTINGADQQILLNHVAYYQNLDAVNRTKFEQMLGDFLSYVRIEGIDLTPDATDRLLIACSAIIPVFGFGHWKYQNLHAVILYPDTFNKDFQFEGGDRNILGMVGTGYMNGQMILSRSALLEGFSISADKENTAIHEFVHLLDKSDGWCNRWDP